MSEMRIATVPSILAGLSPEVRAAVERAQAEREAALDMLTPEARARVEQAELELVDRAVYGNVFRDGAGRRIDPRDLLA